MVVGLIWAVSLQGMVFAAGIVLKIADGALLKDQNNADLIPNYTGPGDAGSANIEFFVGGVPVSPTSIGPIGNKIIDFNYTPLAGIRQYDKSTQTGTVFIRSWDSTPVRAQGRHYGISIGYAAAAGIAPPSQYTVSSFRTDYLADIPVNAPTFTTFSESNLRIGETSEVVLSLGMGWSYSPGAAPNLVVATGYDVKYWISSAGETEPADDDPNRVASAGGLSWSLPATDPKPPGGKFGAGTYNFKVRARNEFGAGPWSTPRVWTTLAGGGVGAAGEVTYAMKKAEGGLGLNSIAILHTPPFNVDTTTPTAVTTIKDLVAAINAKSGVKDTVTTIGWLIPGGAIEGFYITYNETGDATFTPTTGLTAGADAPVEFSKVYQISVLRDVTVKFSR